ncbi:hypothetical protein [Actinoplanes derwentensis]|nr:hypothetical protein [Actinoplanes derwentensis]
MRLLPLLRRHRTAFATGVAALVAGPRSAPFASPSTPAPGPA